MTSIQRPNNQYSREFKLEALRQLEISNRSATELVAELGILVLTYSISGESNSLERIKQTNLEVPKKKIKVNLPPLSKRINISRRVLRYLNKPRRTLPRSSNEVRLYQKDSILVSGDTFVGISQWLL